MLKWVIWGVGALAVLAALDRVLLWCESKGWINYRRSGLSRGGALYHTLELHSVFDPGMKDVLEVKYGEQQQEDESGAPPGRDRNGELMDADVGAPAARDRGTAETDGT